MTATSGGCLVPVATRCRLCMWVPLLLVTFASHRSSATPRRGQLVNRNKSLDDVRITSVLDDGTDPGTTVTFSGWAASKARLNVTGILPSAVSMGRYVVIIGGTELVRPYTSAENFVRYYALTAITALDVTTETLVEPMMFVDSRSFTRGGDDDGGRLPYQGSQHGTRVPAKLLFPAVGTANSVRLGSAVYVVGFCMTLPYGVRPGHGESINNSLRSVQVIRLYQEQFPPADDLTMDIKHISIPDTATLRFNASCVGNGNGTIYIVGGVSLEDGRPLASVSQFNAVTGQFIDAGWSLSTPLITPGVVENSELLFIGGGCRDYRGWPEYNSELYVVDPTYFTADVGQFDPASLDWLSPQLMIYNRTIALIAATYRRTFDRLESWMDLTSAYTDATDVMIGFAPLRTNAVVASVPNTDGMSLYLIGGQIPPPDGTTLSRNIFTGSMYVADGHADVTIEGFNYITVANELTHEQTASMPHGAKGGDALDSMQESPAASFRHSELPEVYGAPAKKPKPPPGDLPNKDGNWTVLVNGYKPLWYNFTFAILLSEQILVSCSGINGTGEVHEEAISPCLLRLSDSPSCNSVLLNVGNLSTSNTWPHPIKTSNTDTNSTVTKNTVAVGPITLTGSLTNGIQNITMPHVNVSDELRSQFVFHPRTLQRVLGNGTGHEFYEQLFVYVCFSTGATRLEQCSDRVAGGASPKPSHTPLGATDAHLGPCTTGFFKPLNANDPYVFSPVTHWVPDPPGPHPAPPPAVQPLYLIAVAAGCGVGFALWSASMITYSLRHKGGKGGSSRLVEGWFSDDESGECDNENEEGETGRQGIGPGAALPVHQKQSLLDGKYRVLRRLGRGGFSVVYLVERVTDGERFALKYVQCADNVDRHEAMRECEVAYTLQGHPNVICLVDMFMSYRFDTHLPSPGGGEEGEERARRRRGLREPLLQDTTRILRAGSSDEEERCAVAQRPKAGERYLSLVMAYHEKGDLGMWVRRQKSEPKVPEKTIVGIAFQILTVLQFMHQQKPPIIHRDLKPENILLDSTPTVKGRRSFLRSGRNDPSSKNVSQPIGNCSSVPEETLRIVVTDFGLSRMMDKTFCETGVGSLPYVAPECWQRHYSTKADIWATGCILYAVCAKRVESDNVKVMFSESNKPDFKKKLLEELTQVYGYSVALASFIVYLLEPDPGRRPSAEEALRLIRKRRKDTDNVTEEAAMVLIYRDDEVRGACAERVTSEAEKQSTEGRSEKPLKPVASNGSGESAGAPKCPPGGQRGETPCGVVRSTSISTHRSGATVEVVTPICSGASRLMHASPPTQSALPTSSFSCGASPAVQTPAQGTSRDAEKRRLQGLEQYFEAVAEEGEQCDFFIARESSLLVAASLTSSKRESPLPLKVLKKP